MRRRALLAAVALAPAAISSRQVRRALSQDPDAYPGLPYRASAPAAAADGSPGSLRVSTQSVYQGGAFLVAFSDGLLASATIFDRQTYLTDDGAGGLFGFIGLGVVDPPGPATLFLDYTPSVGEPYSLQYPMTVVLTQWTVDYIILPPPPPPDPNAPPPPPPPPDENPLLPGIYAGLTPRKWIPGWTSPIATASLDGLNITGNFGEQRSFNGGPVQGHHGGTDFGYVTGTPVHSTNAGVVVLSGLYLTRGNIVIVDHGTGIFSLYGHMSERAVSVGDTVAKGEVVGYVGSTGLSTGPHLHWELAVRGILVDGLRWLDGTQGF